jgi:pimeloyl-ACP methyl ester carboxylesterase
VPSFAITRDGVRVAYEVTGVGAPLLLVHGLGDERTLWLPLIERFAPYFRCVSLDLRGHGQTTGAVDFDPFGLHRDLDAVISDAGLGRPVLIGHSLGGFAATTYAAAHAGKVRAVINVDQPLALDALAAAVTEHQDALHAGEVSRVLMSVLTLLGLGPLAHGLVQRLEHTRAALHKDVVLGVWGPMLTGNLDATLTRMDALLGRIVAPYLCLLGREVDPTYAGWLASRLPAATLESWPGLGHFLHLADPDRFVERVQRFVADV